jgi:hypothetical protein
MKTIEFNTGRKYTAEGQVVRATLHADGVITFMDHSRMIDGEFGPIRPAQELTQALVMAVYDNSTYRSTARSSADGMCARGCNTRTD